MPNLIFNYHIRTLCDLSCSTMMWHHNCLVATLHPVHIMFLVFTCNGPTLQCSHTFSLYDGLAYHRPPLASYRVHTGQNTMRHKNMDITHEKACAQLQLGRILTKTSTWRRGQQRWLTNMTRTCRATSHNSLSSLDDGLDELPHRSSAPPLPSTIYFHRFADDNTSSSSLSPHETTNV